MSEKFQNGVTGVLVLCALAVTGMVARRELFATPPGPRVTQVREWRPLAAVGQRMGPPRAQVTIVEFSDFQCPFCAQAARTLKELRERDPRVAVVYRHFPLNNHPYAFDAAAASACAGRQGRFEAYHDLLFAHQDSLGTTEWDAFATRAGVPDVAAFRACLRDPAVRAEVRRDRAAASKLGIRGTPTFIINGRMSTGSVPPGGWAEAVARAAAR